MSEAEHPARLQPGHQVTVDEVRQLIHASTPHFALQLRERLRRLIRELPADDRARIEAEREIARLDQIALDGEVRGEPAQPGMAPLASVTVPAPAREAAADGD